jgi:arylsulfatase A-like enzyme
VPSRTTFFTGRHTHQIQAWANEQGLAATATNHSELDPNCVASYDAPTCDAWAHEQNVTATFVDTLQGAGCEVCIYGKVDVGGNVIENRRQTEFDPTKTGFHGRSLNCIGRAADIRKPTKSIPAAKMNTSIQHPEDWEMIKECMEWLTSHNPSNTGSPWFLYCSINIPHPGYQSNSSWLPLVDRAKIPRPVWAPESEMHPADSYMSYSKNCMGSFTDQAVLDIRQTWYAMCSETDFMLGEVINVARETGHLNNTVIIFTSDHVSLPASSTRIACGSCFVAVQDHL